MPLIDAALTVGGTGAVIFTVITACELKFATLSFGGDSDGVSANHRASHRQNTTSIDAHASWCASQRESQRLLPVAATV